MKELTNQIITLDVVCSEETRAELQRLCKAVADGAAKAEQHRRDEAWKLPDGYVMLANGNLAQASSVKEQDELEDAMVCDLHTVMAGLAAGVEHFRARVQEDGRAFLDVLKTKYGHKQKNTELQMTMMSLDGQLKIVFERDSRVAFGPDIAHAKKLVFEYLDTKSKGADPVLVELAHQAFTSNKDGYIPVGKVAALWRVKCNDPDWVAAMQAVKDALRPDGAREYVRFYERNTDTGDWELLRAAV